ncbi:MAG: DNA polymerase III subunit gamma/tau [Bacteroidales bacterium]|nr:DNA polymerase III subunit gamma/tau [Bacteroidales bacterium]
MSEYIVSARKYRPATFDSVVGQSALTTTLKNAIASGKLAHAYLFCGPRGVGKTTSARIFAKTINCLNPGPNGEACNECESCRAFNEQRSYNIHELDAASNNSVDDIRDLIEQVMVPPQVGKYKVFIVDEVHMLSAAAFNAFLKTLEEPPSHAIFILATTEKHKILPTILSRCQIYDFNRMEVPDIVAHLKKVAANEGYTAEDEALSVIARKADGGMRDALSIFDQVAAFSQGNITYQKVIDNLNVLDYDYYFDITDSILKTDVTKIMLTLNEILSKGFEGNHFIGGLASHFRDLLVSRDPQTLPLLEVAESVRQRYQEQAQRCQPKFLYSALRLCNDCDINYRTSRNKRLLVELTLIEVAQLLQADDEAASGGRRPAKRLLPIFAPAPAQVAVTQSLHNPPSTSTAGTAPASIAAPVTTTVTTPAATTAQQPIRRNDSISALAKTRLSTISLTRVNTTAPAAAAATPAATAATAATASEPARPAQCQPFTADDLRLQWLTFANTLPVEEAAEAGRLKIVQPVIKENYRIEALVENQVAANYLGKIAPQLTAHLRATLRNDNITVAFPVDETHTIRHAYSPRKILAEMMQKNPALVTLIKTFDLQLD